MIYMACLVAKGTDVLVGDPEGPAQVRCIRRGHRLPDPTGPGTDDDDLKQRAGARGDGWESVTHDAGVADASRPVRPTSRIGYTAGRNLGRPADRNRLAAECPPSGR